MAPVCQKTSEAPTNEITFLCQLKVSIKQYCTGAHYKLRGHDKKLTKARPRLDIRKYFFSQRVVNSWNRLPAIVVNSKSVNAFKNAYDRLCCNDMDVQS